MIKFFFKILLLLIALQKIYCARAETVTAINCVVDTSQPSRNILEITGNYSSTFFNVTELDASTNCHIYIHDIVFSGISFSSSITANSNITIQNATSSNKTRPTFINFGGIISDFGFININNINHSSLEISPTAPTDWISGVQFGSSISGKADSTSSINISNVVMNEINCSSSSQPCQTAMVNFVSTITNLSSLSLSNMSMSDVNSNSSTSYSYVYLFYSGGSLTAPSSSSSSISVNNIRMERVSSNNSGFAKTCLFYVGQSITNYTTLAFSNISISDLNSTSSSLYSLVYVLLCDSVSSSSAMPSSITVSNVRMERVNSRGYTSSEPYLVFVSGTISGYTELSLANMSLAAVNSTSSSSFSFGCLFRSGSVIFSLSSSPSIIVKNLKMEKVNSRGTTNSALHLLLTGSITNYSTISFSNMSVLDVNSHSISGNSEVRIFAADGTLAAPEQVASSLTVNNLKMERITSNANQSAHQCLFYVQGSIINFNFLSITNLSAVDANSTSFTSKSDVFILICAAMRGDSASSIIVRNLVMEKIMSSGTTPSVVYLFSVRQSMTNYSTLAFSNMSVSDLNSTSSNSYSNVFLFYCGGSLAAPSSSSSSITVSNARIERVSSQNSGYSAIFLFFVVQSITNYSTLAFSNMSVSDVNSTSSNSYSQVFLMFAGGSITAPSSSSSSISVNNIRMERVSSHNSGVAQTYLFFVTQSISNYTTLALSNVSVSDVNSTSSNSILYLFYSGGLLTSPTSSSSSISVNNARMERVSSNNSAFVATFLFRVLQSIINYSILSFTNMSISDVNSTSANSYSQVFLVCAGGSLTMPSSSSSSITVNNAKMERLASHNSGAAIIYLFFVGQSITNFTTLTFTNMSISDVNSTSANSYSDVFLFYCGGSLTAPSSSSSSITVNNARMERVSSRSSGYMAIYLFYVGQSISNYTALTFSNMSVSDVKLTCSSSYSQLYMFFSGGSVISSTTSSMTVANIEMLGVNSTALSFSNIFLIFVSQSISGYTTLSFANMSVWDVNSTSSNSYSKIFLISTGSVVAATSTSATNLSSNNLTIRNLRAVAATDARVVLFNMNTIQGFDAITFSDSIMQNILTQSTTDCYTMMIWSGGFLNCNIIRIASSQLTDVVSLSSAGSAMTSLVSVQSSTKTVRVVEINDNLISNISVIAPTQHGKLHLMNSSFNQVEMISLRNNRIRLNSLPSSPSSNISVSMVPLSISSGAINLDISNSTLEIQNQHWHRLCSPTNCSLVRINDIQNNHNKTNISISESSVSYDSSSFISFANFGNTTVNRSDAVLSFVLENNYFLNFSEIVNSSLFGFDNSSHLPPFAFVDVKCNHWSHLVDRMSSQELIAANSAENAEQFVEWTCHTHSASKTVFTSVSSTKSVSQFTFTADATSSSTASPSRAKTATASSSGSSSKTSQSRTVTAMATSTTTSTTTKNATQTRAVEIRVPPQPAKVSPTTAGITTAVVVVTSLIANPTLGPPMVRNGLILLGGSCGENVGPLDAATSPLGLEIGKDDYKYWNGAVIGDFIIIMTSFPILLLISVAFVKIFKKDRPWNEYIVGVRTITGTFFLVLSGPIIVGFMAAISFSSAGAETLGVLILGLATLAATVLWPLHILRRAHKEMQLEVLNEGDHDDLELSILNSEPTPQIKEKETSVLKRFHEFLFDSRTGAEWTPLLHELRVSWAYLFEHSASLTYVAIEVICGTGINVTLGLMQDPEATDYACRVRALMNLMLHIPPTAFLLFANPLLSRFDVAVTTAMWIGNMFSSLMLVLKLFDLGLPIDATLYVVGLILAVLNLVATLALAMDAWQMIRLLQEKQKSYSYLEGNMIMNNNIDSDLDELLLNDVGAFVNERNNDNNDNNNYGDEFREGVNQEMQNQIPVSNDDDDALTNREQHNMQSSARPGFDEDYFAVLEKLVTSVKNEK